MRPEVVAAGIDSLNIGFNIREWLLDESVFKQLSDGKDAAGQKLFGGKGITVNLKGKDFNLQPKGTRGYEYVMNNEDVRLCLARNCQGGRVYPEAFVELNSSFLWREGHEGAYKKLREWLGEFAVIVGEKVNRVDVCVDLAIKLPRINMEKEIVTRAKNKVDYFQVEKYSKGKRDTGYRIGSGTSISARIYDKSYEIKNTEKLWFGDIWKLKGWDGKSDVTRVEFQNRRPILKEYGVNSYSDMVTLLPDMWRYLTGEWLVIKQANSNDSNNRRWETSVLWEAVQDAGSKFGQCLGVQRWKQKQAKIEPLMAQIKGLIASEVAIDSMIRGEYFAISRLQSEINSYLKSEEFFNKLLERRGRYGSMS